MEIEDTKVHVLCDSRRIAERILRFDYGISCPEGIIFHDAPMTLRGLNRGIQLLVIRLVDESHKFKNELDEVIYWKRFTNVAVIWG